MADSSQDHRRKDAAGHGAAFPSTRWSRLIVAPGAASAEADAAFEMLARRYWRPIAAYARARWAKNDEEAHDATQEFFLWMLESGFLGRADPQRGSFRGFIKTTFAHFLHDLDRRRRTVKRGGHQRILALDAADSRRELELPDPSGLSADEILDELWRKEVLSQATDALEAELDEGGRQRVFAVFRDYFLGAEELDYAAVAARYGITSTDVSNYLMTAKRRYRAHLRAAVMETVRSDDDLRAELAWLLEGDSP